MPRAMKMVRSLAGAADWARRCSRFVSAEDLKHFGPMGVFQTVSRFMAKERFPDGLPQGLDARDPEFVGVMVELIDAIGRTWFRSRCDGVHHVLAQGPALLIGNHNGAVMPLDTLLTVAALWNHFGPSRPVHVLSHDLIWADPVGRRLAARFGMLRAHPESAAKALGAGHIVLAYPGSDLDGFRPFTRRNRVELAGRTGFIRIALRQGVPVVPVVSAGTHEQLIVLSDGRKIARRLRLKRLLRSEGFPIVLALPWGLTSGFFPYLPLPAQTTIQFGPPIGWPSLGPSDAEEPQVVLRCYEEVRSTMQHMLDELTRDRLPWVGTRPSWLR